LISQSAEKGKNPKKGILGYDFRIQNFIQKQLTALLIVLHTHFNENFRTF